VLETSLESPEYRNLITVRAAMPDGAVVAVSGTLVGSRQVEKLTAVYGYEVDLPPARHLAFLRYRDRPGVVGAVGALLGEASVNIASAQVSRHDAGGDALMSLALDEAVPEAVLHRIADTIGATTARAVEVTS
jgi:D-3-phosphoglycerate dehydrogenase